MKKCSIPVVCILFGSLALSGCGVGYTRTLFLTKSTIGLDVAVAPKPTVELALSRFEGVVAPQFEEGKKLPVLASFRFANGNAGAPPGSSGVFSPSIGSTYATGDAAIAMAALYGDATDGSNAAQRLALVDANKGKPKYDSTLALKHKPAVPCFVEGDFQTSFGLADHEIAKNRAASPANAAATVASVELELQDAIRHYKLAQAQLAQAATPQAKASAQLAVNAAYENAKYYDMLRQSIAVSAQEAPAPLPAPETAPGSTADTATADAGKKPVEVKPVVFGTDTSLGVKVTWSGMTGGFPDSAHLGFKRVELGYVPITMRHDPTAGTFNMKMASLLATVDTGVSIGESGAIKTDMAYLQYFATGDAATLLAMQQAVRRAMLARLDPNQKKQIKLFAKDLTGPSHNSAMVLLVNVNTALDYFAKDGDKRATELTSQLRAFSQRVMPDFYYKYTEEPASGSTPVNLVEKRETLPKSIAALISYEATVKQSQSELTKQLAAASFQFKKEGASVLVVVNNNDAEHKRLQQVAKDQLAELDRLKSEIAESQVVAEALTHYMDKMLKTRTE